LERRDRVTNVVAATVGTLLTPDAIGAEVRQIEPPTERETGRTPAEAGELAAVMPAAHSFGRRGR
jgi:hypothetical protein